MGQGNGRTIEYCMVKTIYQGQNFTHTKQKHLGAFEVRPRIHSLKFFGLALDAISPPPSLTQNALDLFINS